MSGFGSGGNNGSNSLFGGSNSNTFGSGSLFGSNNNQNSAYGSNTNTQGQSNSMFGSNSNNGQNQNTFASNNQQNTGLSYTNGSQASLFDSGRGGNPYAGQINSGQNTNNNNNSFGQSSLFGGSNNQNQNQNQNQNSNSIFGSNTNTNTNGSNSLFGSNSNSNTNANSNSLFGGGSTTQNQNSNSMFGNNNQQSQSLFGGNSNTQTNTNNGSGSNSIFGSTNNSSQQNQNSNSIFGGGSGTGNNSNSMFGSSNQQSSSLFGGSNNNNNAGGNSLYGSTTNNSNSMFGGSNNSNPYSSNQNTQQQNSNSIFGTSNNNGGSNTNSLFGSNTNTNTNTAGNSMFGNNSSNNTSMFGSGGLGSGLSSTNNNSNSVFGSNNTGGNGSLFGSNTQSQTNSMFGSTNPQNSLYGNNNTGGNNGSLFGGSNQNSQTNSMFGGTTSNTNGSNSLFGSNTNNNPSTSLYGSSNTNNGSSSIFGNNSTTAQNNNNSMFGGSNTNNQSNSLYGSTTNNNNGSLFGSTNTQQQNSNSIFGGGTTNTNNNNGSNSLFGGSSNNNQSGSLFGGNNTPNNNSSIFSRTTGSVFGSSNNAGNGLQGSSLFGSTPQNNNSMFGSNNNQGSSLFGSDNNKSSSLFGNNNSSNNSLLGGSNSNSIFGGNSNNSSNSLFGNNQSNSLFGGQPKQQGLFGSTIQSPMSTNSMFANQNSSNKMNNYQSPATGFSFSQGFQMQNGNTQRPDVFNQNPAAPINQSFLKKPVAPFTWGDQQQQQQQNQQQQQQNGNQDGDKLLVTPNLQNLVEYDALGFNMESIIVQYKQSELANLITTSHLADLEKIPGYPPILEKYFETEQKNKEVFPMDLKTKFDHVGTILVWDVKEGTILWIMAGRKDQQEPKIIQAIQGFKVLSQKTIEARYGNPPTFKALNYPEQIRQLEKEDGAYWVFSGPLQSCYVYIVFTVTHLIKTGRISISNMQFAFDLMEVSCRQFQGKAIFNSDDDRVNTSKSSFFYKLYTEPQKYIEEQPDKRKMLVYLRSRKNQPIFLTTNHQPKFMDTVMSHTLGPDWSNLFDLCLASCRQPLFQRAECPFYEMDTKDFKKGRRVQTAQELKSAGTKTFLEGNAITLTEYLQMHLDKQNIKIGYVGSNYLENILPTHEITNKLRNSNSLASWIVSPVTTMAPKYVGHDKSLAFTFDNMPKLLSGMDEEELIPVYKEELMTRSLGMDMKGRRIPKKKGLDPKKEKAKKVRRKEREAEIIKKAEIAKMKANCEDKDEDAAADGDDKKEENKDKDKEKKEVKPKGFQEKKVDKDIRLAEEAKEAKESKESKDDKKTDDKETDVKETKDVKDKKKKKEETESEGEDEAEAEAEGDGEADAEDGEETEASESKSNEAKVKKEVPKVKKHRKKKSKVVEEVVPNCATHNCLKPGVLQCPTCIHLDISQTFFCSQDCFAGSWKIHRMKHLREAMLRKPKRMEVNTVYTRGNQVDDGPQVGMLGATQRKADKFAGELRPFPRSLAGHRQVPDRIMKPDYAESGQPSQFKQSQADREIPVYTKEDIDGIRAAALLARKAVDIGHAMVKPGVTTEAIDAAVHDFLVENDAYPSCLNYYRFPRSCCTSINEVICHGIPDTRQLVEGDIINLDVTAYKDGYHGDMNETFCVGAVDLESRKLVTAAYDALMAAIAICRPGTMYRQLGGKVSELVEPLGFSVVRNYVGHGTGKIFHCAPTVPHYKGNKAVGVMKPGHVFCFEPMINGGDWDDFTWPDNWTSSTRDGERSAQFEHTILITETGCELLTARLESSPPLEIHLPSLTALPLTKAQIALKEKRQAARKTLREKKVVREKFEEIQKAKAIKEEERRLKLAKREKLRTEHREAALKLQEEGIEAETAKQKKNRKKREKKTAASQREAKKNDKETDKKKEKKKKEEEEEESETDDQAARKAKQKAKKREKLKEKEKEDAEYEEERKNRAKALRKSKSIKKSRKDSDNEEADESTE